MSNVSGFSKEIEKLKEITSKLTENGYLVDRTAQWEFAFDAVQDLVLIVNPNLEIKFINKAFADRLEVNRTAVINNYCYNILQCPNCQKTPGDCLLSYGEPAEVEKGDVYIEDHLQGWFNFTHSPIYDDEENLLGFICVLNDITERKQIEEALKKSEAKYQDLYDNAPDMFVSVDADTAVITRCNQTLLDTLGYTREEIIGQSIFFVYASKSIEKAKETFHIFVEEGEIRDVHMRLQKKDGSKLDVSLNVTAIRDETGKIIQSRSSWRNITEYRKIQEALRKSEEKYRSIYETAPLAFVVWDYNSNVIEWNKNAERMFGYTKEEVVGKSFFDFIIPKTAERHVQEIVDLLRLGEVTTSINENITKDGDMILCEWNNSIYNDCSGKPMGFISLAANITELKEKEDLIKSIFKASPAGIGLVKERVIQWTNQRLRDMIGYSEEELLNQSARIFYSSEKEYQRVGDVKYKRLHKDGFGYIKTVWQKKDGELIDILLSSAYVDDSDHSKGVTFTATDVIIWD